MSDLMMFHPFFGGNAFDGTGTLANHRGAGALTARQGHGHLSVDFVENDTNYVVHADLPGYSKDDINVHVEDGVLSLEASKTETKEENTDKYYFKERFCGKVHRSFRLPVNANTAEAAVSYKDGVLAVTIPKSANSGAKKLAIA
jgi:HSP20 family protein